MRPPVGDRTRPGSDEPAERYVAVDVHYPAEGGAVAAAVVVADLAFGCIVAERLAHLDQVEPYQPGAFWRREWPAVSAVLSGLGRIDLVLVDGYVHLDADGRPGLGAHVAEELDVPVIGVAKTAFRGAEHAVQVVRAPATKPLYVTAAGMAAGRAAELVSAMAGRYRLPDALRRVDALARGTVQPSRGPS